MSAVLKLPSSPLARHSLGNILDSVTLYKRTELLDTFGDYAMLLTRLVHSADEIRATVFTHMHQFVHGMDTVDFSWRDPKRGLLVDKIPVVNHTGTLRHNLTCDQLADLLIASYKSRIAARSVGRIISRGVSQP